MTKLEFFFDCSSPWTYLAFVGIQPIIARVDVNVHWRPILVGGVFNVVNQDVYQYRAQPNPRRENYYSKDLNDWFRHYGLMLNWPDVFPVNSVKAMRGAFIALEKDCLVRYCLAVFEAYWRDNKDISRDDVLAEIVESQDMDSQAFFEKINHPDYKQALRVTTQNLIDRGGFGSPTMFVNDTDMYFGNDRLILVESMLKSQVQTSWKT